MTPPASEGARLGDPKNKLRPECYSSETFSRKLLFFRNLCDMAAKSYRG